MLALLGLDLQSALITFKVTATPHHPLSPQVNVFVAGHVSGGAAVRAVAPDGRAAQPGGGAQQAQHGAEAAAGEDAAGRSARRPGTACVCLHTNPAVVPLGFSIIYLFESFIASNAALLRMGGCGRYLSTVNLLFLFFVNSVPFSVIIYLRDPRGHHRPSG